MILLDTDFNSTDRTRACRYIIEQFVNGAWHTKESVDVVSGTPEAKRRFLLERDERLVVVELLTEIPVWDHEQMATKMVPQIVTVPPVPEELKYSTQVFDVAKTKR